MPFEIDFLAVGEGSKGGDAIALRYGADLARRDAHRVVIIDGGTRASGEALVNHVRYQYNTNRVDLVLNTHPDNDHVCGLQLVLQNLEVDGLAMHRPWNHAAQVRWTFRDGRLTDASLSEKLRRSIEAAHELEALAMSRAIPVVEPFSDSFLDAPGGAGRLVILGPSLDYYQRLLCDFRETPTARYPGLLGPAAEAVRKVKSWGRESLDMATETLRDDGETSAENNSSVIALLAVDGQRVLLTADAGIPALEQALNYAQSGNLDLVASPLFLFQAPHHGSRRNIGPRVLNRMRATHAVVSAPPESEKHPASKVVNALIRRGSVVHATKGTNLRYQWNAPPRHGWQTVAPPLPFSEIVEI